MEFVRPDNLECMGYRDAAETILRDAEQPLTTHEILERALAAGLISPSGKTPKASLSAALYRAPAESPISRRLSSPDASVRIRGSSPLDLRRLPTSTTQGDIPTSTELTQPA